MRFFPIFLLSQQVSSFFLPYYNNQLQQRTTATTFLSSSTQKEKPNAETDDPTALLEKAFSKGYQKRENNNNKFDDEPVLLTDGEDEYEQAESVDIPRTGISVSDTIMDNDREVYQTELVAVKKAPGVAMIHTKAEKSGGFDPIRYIVALTPPPPSSSNDDDDQLLVVDYVLTDIPPFSEELAASIRKFMKGGRLAAILLTSKTSIHYDEGPAVYTTRNSHLSEWVSAFPSVAVVGYRLDVPRYGASLFTQKLNGYGPWAWNTSTQDFEESGRPLVSKEWDSQTIQAFLKNGMLPIDEADEHYTSSSNDENDYSPESIRQREEGKELLAVYTPGNTHGTLSYVFPQTNVVVSAFTIPIEEIPEEGRQAGPALDARGYITTSKAGMAKQMASARQLVRDYGDRFGVVLSARSEPEFLDEMDVEDRKKALFNLMDQYEEIGRQYQKAGVGEDEDDDDDE